MTKYWQIWILNALYVSLIVLSTLFMFDLWVHISAVYATVFFGVVLWGVLSIVMSKHLNEVYTYLGIPGLKFSDQLFMDATETFEKYLDLQHEVKTESNKIKSYFLEMEEELKEVSTTYEHYQRTYDEIDKTYEKERTFFESVANILPQRIWVSDVKGNILYSNRVLKASYANAINMSDLLFMENGGSELFLTRDFGNIQYHFCKGEVVLGKSIRIFSKDMVRVVLHIVNPNDFEKRMTKNYLRKSRDLHVINEIGKIVIGRSTIVGTLQEALNKIAFFNNLNSISVRLLTEENELEMIALSGYATKYVLGPKIGNEKLHMRQAFNENRMIFLNHLDDFMFPEPALEEFVKDGGKIAYIPLANFDSTFGILSIASDYEFNTESLILYEAISINLTIALEKMLLYDQLKSNYFKTVEAFVTATEINSSWFSGHSRRVAEICRTLAKQLYLSEEEIDEIYISGLLHDVGKMSSVLTGEIDELDEQHSLIGRKLIEKVGLSEAVLDGIEYHHMDFDLKKTHYINSNMTEQPFYAQIIRIANDLDWLMSDQDNIMRLEEAFEIIKEGSGSLYADQFIRILQFVIKDQNNEISKLYTARSHS